MKTFRFKFSASYAISFFLLLIVMMELHEVVHISVGRALCGCWGPRDFNVWSLCEGCKENQPFWWLATLAGPVFSFSLMWLGMAWLNSTDMHKQALGFSFIFANIPFGRISTVMMGGGDEMVVVRYFFQDHFGRLPMILIGTAVVLAAGLPPIIRSAQVLSNRFRWLYIVGFLTAPLAFLLGYLLMGLNTLLEQGFLKQPWILGTPLLITLHTAVAAIILFLIRKNLLLINAQGVSIE